jgi:hypothetical protein
MAFTKLQQHTLSVHMARFSVCRSLSPQFLCLLRSIGFINCSFSGGAIVCVCNPHRRVQLDKSLKGLVKCRRIDLLCCSASSHNQGAHPSHCCPHKQTDTMAHPVPSLDKQEAAGCDFKRWNLRSSQRY